MILLKVKYDKGWLPPIKYREDQHLEAKTKYNTLRSQGHEVKFTIKNVKIN